MIESIQEKLNHTIYESQGAAVVLEQLLDECIEMSCEDRQNFLS